MSVLDGFTETILILSGIIVGVCISTISIVLLNMKKKNKNTKLDTVV